MSWDVAEVKQVVLSNALPIVTHIVGAIALWVIGRWIIGMVRRLIVVAAAKRLDPTLVRYLESATQVLLSVLLLDKVG